MKLEGFKVGFNIPNLGVNLNVTLDLDLTAHNPNHASFCYGKSPDELFYKGS